ncbi:hypothetical protein GLYMA_09G214800v4 [Glycine max]|uniref:Uncharacterized protein n=1 Tax=Glycine max TaxID=3847 RepID=K7LF89_SOYBN|nr:hypothetical protein JHK87_025747 [Glycine soja]KAG5007881.1 hypothetical protein JHK85_026423 [Glycine max]KAH1044127.1 hypothetical protein GYH30_025758 [Glycine max]KRH39694.1 hypothetical protein GLYMA_09G214800v4 [Glycine max]
MEGETKFCATSLEPLFDFTRYLFGSNAQFKVLTIIHLTDSTGPFTELHNLRRESDFSFKHYRMSPPLHSFLLPQPAKWHQSA